REHPFGGAGVGERVASAEIEVLDERHLLVARSGVQLAVRVEQVHGDLLALAGSAGGAGWLMNARTRRRSPLRATVAAARPTTRDASRLRAGAGAGGMRKRRAPGAVRRTVRTVVARGQRRAGPAARGLACVARRPRRLRPTADGSAVARVGRRRRRGAAAG